MHSCPALVYKALYRLKFQLHHSNIIITCVFKAEQVSTSLPKTQILQVLSESLWHIVSHTVNFMRVHSCELLCLHANLGGYSNWSVTSGKRCIKSIGILLLYRVWEFQTVKHRAGLCNIIHNWTYCADLSEDYKIPFVPGGFWSLSREDSLSCMHLLWM